jgi:HEAT repeat protein
VVRWNAAAALADFPDDDFAGDVLAGALMDASEDPGVRRLAAWAIGRRRDQGAEWALRAAALDPDEVVSQAARHALEAINNPSGNRCDRCSGEGATGEMQ